MPNHSLATPAEAVSAPRDEYDTRAARIEQLKGYAQIKVFRDSAIRELKEAYGITFTPTTTATLAVTSTTSIRPSAKGQGSSIQRQLEMRIYNAKEAHDQIVEQYQVAHALQQVTSTVNRKP